MVQASLPPDSAPESRPRTALRYELSGFADDWIIPEVPVPEAVWHDHCLELFRQLLAAWVARSGRAAFVFRDIAIGVRRERPRVGFNPDVCVVEPAPGNAQELESLKLYEEGVSPPVFAFEAVSRNHPYKDYALVPEKCAVVGVQELVVFDPLLAGPRAQGGPWLLQVWRRAPDNALERVYAGAGRTRSEYLGAYLLPDRDARTLRISDDPAGAELWSTFEEEARHREQEARHREQEARHREQEARRREQAALERVAELEAELRRRNSSST
jgi:hypothetical protein